MPIAFLPPIFQMAKSAKCILLSDYHKKNTGTCKEENLVSEVECRKRATDKGKTFPDDAFTGANYPPGCYVWTADGRHYYNKNLTSTSQCTSERTCICATRKYT